MDTYKAAGKGIYFLFIGQIVSLFTFIPFLGVIAMIAGAALSLYGLYMMAQAESGYQPAMILTIAGFVINLLGVLFFKTGFMSALFDIISGILNFMVVYYICNTTGRLLQGINNTLADRATTIWKLYLICTVIFAVCSLLSVIPIINIFAAVIAIAVAIVQLVASILYLIFTWNSQKALQSYGNI